MPLPKVTVLMPVYNAESTVCQAIDSILEQTFTDFQFLIIDDGSTDKTVERVGSYHDDRIRLIVHEENRGIAATLNHGLELIDTPYVARMDADDIAHERRLEILVNHMESKPLLAMVGSMRENFTNQDEKRLDRQRELPPVAVQFTSHMIRAGLLLNNSQIAHPTVLIRMSTLRKSALLYSEDASFIGAEDYELWTRLAYDYEIEILNQPLLYYRLHEHSVTRQKNSNRLSAHHTIITNLLRQQAIVLPEEAVRNWVQFGLQKLTWSEELEKTIQKVLNHVYENVNLRKRIDWEFLTYLIQLLGERHDFGMKREPQFYTVDASSGPHLFGIERAQLVRQKIFDDLGQAYRFIYYLRPNIGGIYDRFVANGYRLDRIELIYHAFTDLRNAVASFTLEDFLERFQIESYQVLSSPEGQLWLQLPTGGQFRCLLNSEGYIIEASLFFEQRLRSTLYFTYTLVNELLYIPLEDGTIGVEHRYYNEDGSVAYTIEEVGDEITYFIGNHILESETEFFAFYFRCQTLSKQDWLLLERPQPSMDFLLHRSNRNNAQLGYFIHFNYENRRFHYGEHAFERIFPLKGMVDFYLTTAAGQMGQIEAETDSTSQKYFMPVGYVEPIQGLPERRQRKCLRLITVSRLSFEKNIDLAIEVVVAARRKGLDCELTIVGTGDDEVKLRSLVREYQAEEAIHFAGFQFDVGTFFQENDAYLSTSESEAFGTSLLEAMGYGLPLIGRNVPFANQDYITQGVNGYLIEETRDRKTMISGYVEAIEYLLSLSPQEYTGLCLASLTVAGRFTYEELKANWRQFLE